MSLPIRALSLLSTSLLVKLRLQGHQKQSVLTCWCPQTLFIESLNGFGWKGPHIPPSPTCAMGWVPPAQPVQGPSTTWVSCGQCRGLAALRVKNFFLTPDLNLPSFCSEPIPPCPITISIKSSSPSCFCAPFGHQKAAATPPPSPAATKALQSAGDPSSAARSSRPRPADAASSSRPGRARPGRRAGLRRDRVSAAPGGEESEAAARGRRR